MISGSIFGASTLLREDYPFAHFFHCAAHRLNLVLCQLASSILVKVFFLQISLLLARDVHIGGVGGRHAPNIFKFAKTLVKRQPCWKRVGNTTFCDLIFLSNNS